MKRRLIIKIAVLMVMGTAVVVTVLLTRSAQKLEPVHSEYRSLWLERGSSNYQITVVTTALPSPPIGLKLTIQDRAIIQQSIIACDNPSEDYPASYCEPISLYYSEMGKHTVDDLFDQADECRRRTQMSLATCPAFTVGEFQGFSTTDELFTVIEGCREYFQPSAQLCAVEYEPYYGYPEIISQYTHGVSDGWGSIVVEELQLLQ